MIVVRTSYIFFSPTVVNHPIYGSDLNDDGLTSLHLERTAINHVAHLLPIRVYIYIFPRHCNPPHRPLVRSPSIKNLKNNRKRNH